MNDLTVIEIIERTDRGPRSTNEIAEAIAR